MSTLTPITTDSAVALGVLETARLVASSPRFIARCGGGSPEQAAAKVFYPETDADPKQILEARPFAVVSEATEEWTRDSAGTFAGRAAVQIELQDRNRAAGNRHEQRQASWLDFATWIGEVLADVLRQAAEEQLPILKVLRTAEDGPFRCAAESEPANAGGFWFVRYRVVWGFNP